MLKKRIKSLTRVYTQILQKLTERLKIETFKAPSNKEADYLTCVEVWPKLKCFSGTKFFMEKYCAPPAEAHTRLALNK